MTRNFLFGIGLLAAVSFGAAPVLAADPSMHEVYQAAESGNYAAAQKMMDQVLHDHPNSAKAHFVEAELLAKQGKFTAAQNELSMAERIAPGLPFAKPAAVQELKTLLAQPHSASVPAAAAYTAAPAAVHFPWGLLIVGLVLVVAIIFFIRSRRQSVTYIPAGAGNAPYGGGAAYGPQPYPYGPQPYGPASGGGVGSGILGGLATGAAVGAGMVAGEALMHRMMDGGHVNSVQNDGLVPSGNNWDNGTSQYDMGGNDFGVSDAGSWDDSGGGGDDWN